VIEVDGANDSSEALVEEASTVPLKYDEGSSRW
jgi:hypothetical protein